MNLFITGMPRSGTTWLGKTFESSNEFHEISEPFNPKVYNPHLDVKKWFNIFNSNSKDIERSLALRKDIKWFSNEIKKHKSLRFVVGSLRLLFTNRRILLKDPISFFNIDFFCEVLDFKTIVVVKNPAAVVVSFRRVKWSFSLETFLDNPDFLNKMSHLGFDLTYWKNKNYSSELEELCDIWNLFLSYTIFCTDRGYSVTLIKLEDLISNPLREVELLFNDTKTNFSKSVEDYLKKSTTKKDSLIKGSNEVHVLERDSKKDLNKWEKELTSSEIDIIKQITKPFGKDIYPEFYRA